MGRIKSYSQMIQFPSFEDRFRYLKLDPALVGETTFGGHRWVNQEFYRSNEWKNFRNWIIVRDNGCDLAIPDRQLDKGIIVHHINPIEPDTIDVKSILLNPDNVVCVSKITHNAIHYGSEETIVKDLIERRQGDTKLW